MPGNSVSRDMCGGGGGVCACMCACVLEQLVIWMWPGGRLEEDCQALGFDLVDVITVLERQDFCRNFIHSNDIY